MSWLKKQILIIAIICVVMLAFGITLKFTHKNIENFNKYEVLLMDEDKLSRELVLFNNTLDDSKIIIVATCESGLKADYKCAYQNMKVDRVIKGDKLSEGDKINVLKISNISDTDQRLWLDQGFVCEFKEGKSYLLFLDKKLITYDNSLYTPSKDYFMFPYFPIGDVSEEVNAPAFSNRNTVFYGDTKDQDVLLSGNSSMEKYLEFREELFNKYNIK